MRRPARAWLSAAGGHVNAGGVSTQRVEFGRLRRVGRFGTGWHAGVDVRRAGGEAEPWRRRGEVALKGWGCAKRRPGLSRKNGPGAS